MFIIIIVTIGNIYPLITILPGPQRIFPKEVNQSYSILHGDLYNTLYPIGRPARATITLYPIRKKC